MSEDLSIAEDLNVFSVLAKRSRIIQISLVCEYGYLVEVQGS